MTVLPVVCQIKKKKNIPYIVVKKNGLFKKMCLINLNLNFDILEKSITIFNYNFDRNGQLIINR